MKLEPTEEQRKILAKFLFPGEFFGATFGAGSPMAMWIQARVDGMFSLIAPMVLEAAAQKLADRNVLEGANMLRAMMRGTP